MQMVCKISDEVEMKVAQAAQEPKLLNYNTFSTRIVEPTNQFDDRLRDLLLSLSSGGKKGLIESTVQYCDSLGFTQKFYFPDQLIKAAKRFACDTEDKELDIVRTPRGSWRTTNLNARKKLAAELKKVLPPGGLKMHHILSDDDVSQVLSTLDTSAGWDGYVNSDVKGTKKKDLQVGMADEFRTRCVQAKKDGSFNTPYMAFSRSQTSLPYSDDYKERVPENMVFKDRLVLCGGTYATLNEAQFSRPIQDMMSRVAFYAGGKNDQRTESLLYGMMRSHSYWTSIDFSHYDQSVQAWLISDAFDILRELFNEDENFDEQLWNVVVHDFIHKTIYGPGGVLFTSRNGVPSGSMFTSIIDSLCNYIMLESYFESRGIGGRHMMVMGDDNISFTDVPLDLEDMQGYMRSVYGMTMHPHKCTAGTNSDHPDFLSRVWTPRGVYRNPIKLIVRMLYTERRREYDKLGFTPDDVLYAYYLSFPLGVLELLDPDLFRKWLSRYRGKTKTSVDPNALSGITRYRLLYQQDKMTEFEFRHMMTETLKVA